MNNLIVLHNSRCMKSRNALKVLEEQNIPYSIVLYLEGTLDIKDLKDLLSKLRLNPSDIVRKTDALYKEYYKGKDFSNVEWLEILVLSSILTPLVISTNGPTKTLFPNLHS